MNEVLCESVISLTCILVNGGLRDLGELAVGSDVVVLLVVEAGPGLDHRQLADLRLTKR